MKLQWCHWIPTEILKRETVSQRVELINFFIKLAEVCQPFWIIENYLLIEPLLNSLLLLYISSLLLLYFFSPLCLLIVEMPENQQFQYLHRCTTGITNNGYFTIETHLGGWSMRCPKWKMKESSLFNASYASWLMTTIQHHEKSITESTQEQNDQIFGIGGAV